MFVFFLILIFLFVLILHNAVTRAKKQHFTAWHCFSVGLLHSPHFNLYRAAAFNAQHYHQSKLTERD